MEIEAKWETSKTVFNAIVNAFPNGGTKYGYNLKTRWQGELRKYVDIYYDNTAEDLSNNLNMFRHRQRFSPTGGVSISDPVEDLEGTTWNVDWQKVQYKSTPTRLGSVWFRAECGNQDLRDAEVANTLAGNVPPGVYTPEDNPVALLLGDHPGFNFGGLNDVLEVHQYRYRVKFKDPSSAAELFELSLDKIVTNTNGDQHVSFGVGLELLGNGMHQEDLAQDLFTIVQQMEREFCLQSANVSKGNIWVDDATLPVSEHVNIDGTIRLEDGSTVQDAPITFLRQDGGISQCVTSGADGAYQITLPVGDYWFRVPHKDKEDAVGTVEISPNTVVTRDMTLRNPRLTTVLLVRHAEREDDSSDSELSEAGWRRAKQLAHLARKVGVTAVYTTDYKRTRHTVEPLAKFYLKLNPVIYDYDSSQNLVNAIRSDHTGDVVLVAGHSDTLLPIANQFGSDFSTDQYHHVKDFDNLFIIGERVNGTSALNVINLQYGEPSDSPPPTADAANVTEITNLLLVRQDVEQAGSTQRPKALAHVAQKSGISAVYADPDQNQDLVQPLVDLPDDDISAAQPYDPANVPSLMTDVIETHGGETVLIAGEPETLQAIIEAVNCDYSPILDEEEYDNLYVVTVHDSTAPLESRLLSLQYGLPSPQKNVSVVQVIDRTGSMSHRDTPSEPTYMASARVAAQTFIGLMATGDQAGVVAFDDEDCDNAGSKVEGIFNLTELSDETTRTSAISSIDGIDDRGCTSIGAGIAFAQGSDFLADAAPNQPHAMVLLTDGFENRSPWVRERPSNYSHLPATPDNVLPAVPNDIDIYTIALGPNADQPLLRDIADTTGAKFYEVPSILGLLSIYYQIHGDLVVSEMVNLETGLKQAGNDTRTAMIDAFAGEATFILGWLQSKARMVLKLSDPDGKEVDLSDPTVEIGSHSNHHYIKIRRPLAGKWTVRLLRRDDHRFPVDYTYAVFVKDTEKVWSFTPEITMAGECLIPRVRLYETHSERPITRATVKAIVSHPKRSKLTLNYEYVTANRFKWHPRRGMVLSEPKGESDIAKTSQDPLTPLAKNLAEFDQETMARTGTSIFQYKTTAFVLHDDGNHNDAGADDGVYAACIDSTWIAGGHNLRFEISGVSVTGQPFTRKRLATATIVPGAVDVDKTLVRADAILGDGFKEEKVAVIIVPMDRFGNVWGAGHASRIFVTTTAGVLSGPLYDNGDGFYVQMIRGTKAARMGNATVTIDGRKMAATPKITFCRLFDRSIGIHFGAAVPNGSFSKDQDSGHSLGL